MSHAISLHHGPFGRVALYCLDRPMVAHAHREAHLIFYVAGDPGLMCVSGQNCCVDPVHAVAVSPWEQHSFESAGSGRGVYIILYIRPNWYSQFEGLGNADFTFGNRLLSLTPGVTRWVQRLGDLLAAKDVSREVDDCIFETTSRCYQLSWKGQQFDAHCGPPQDRRISRAIGLMNDRFATDIEMNWLARESALSRPHFFKLFKREVGVTPNIYLNTLRSERAIDELLETKKTMGEIGFDLGFSSQASFTRFFSSNVGVTPTDYRRVSLRQ